MRETGKGRGAASAHLMHRTWIARSCCVSLASMLLVLSANLFAVTVPADVVLAKEQVLHRGNGSEPGTLDPHRASGDVAADILRDLYEGLTSEDLDNKVVPGVAERWDMSEDGKTYRFYLRKNARWSNGDPLTAQDFVYALRRSVDPQLSSVYAQVLAPIVNVEAIIAGEKPPESLGVSAIDAHTVQIRLNGPTPYLPGLLTLSVAYPVHRASVEKYGEQFSRPDRLIGNGAFVLKEWVVNDHIKVVRNPYYWDNASTVLDAVYFYPIEDQSSELKRYRAGELDWTKEVPNNQFKWIKKNLANELHVTPMLTTYYYDFNVTRPPFKDNPKLRQALSMAIDRDIIAEKVAGVGEVPAWAWVPPGIANYTPQLLPYHSMTREARLGEARRLYAEAGYSQSNPLQTQIRYNTSENHKRIAIAVASMWRKNLGVQVRLLNEEWKVFIKNREGRVVTRVMRDGWSADYNDAYSFLQILQTGFDLNYSGYSNPAYDRLVEAAALEADLTRRAHLMEQAERLMLADHPLMPIYHYVTKRLVKPYVGNYRNGVMDHSYSKYHYIIKH